MSPEEAKEIARRGLRDPAFFARAFFPHWIQGRQPAVHLGMLAALCRRCEFLLGYPEELRWIERNFAYWDDPEDETSQEHRIFEVEWEGERPKAVRMFVSRFTIMMLPRGCAKTTIGNIAVLWWILYQMKRHIVYISESSHHAETQLQNIRGELSGNDRIHAVFGNLKPLDAEAKWTQKFFETATGVAVAARGRGSQVRGMLHNGDRPDAVLLDDVEDEESVLTPEQREKTENWLYQAVTPALNRMDPDATLVGSGTLLHAEALLVKLQSNTDYTVIRFGAVDRDGEPLWPESMSAEFLERTKNNFARAGKLPLYYREYFNRIRDDATALFQRGYLQLASPQPGERLHCALAMDPAISEKRRADYAGLSVVGISDRGRHYVMEAWGKQGASPGELVDKFFEFYLRYQPERAGIESVAYQAALIHLVREEMFRRGTYFELTPITHSRADGSKIERIKGILQPRYRSGHIFHARSFPLLEQQLLDFPNGKKDLPDALAMAIALLDPYAAQAADPTVDLAADSYAPLDEVLGAEYEVQYG